MPRRSPPRCCAASSREAGLLDAVPITEIPLGGKFSLPPFELELITMTHSILEPNALAIRTKLGTVFHTGDWKIDPEPLLGEVTDEAMLRRIGEEGALAMVCDSTNVFVEGEAGSEATVRANLEKLVKTRQVPRRRDLLCLQPGARRERGPGRRRGRAAIPCCRAGPCSAWSRRRRNAATCSISRHCIPEQQAGYLPREKVLFICTGSQGEPRASMAKLANGEHRDLVLEEGDTAIFSSRVIPGNERSVGRLQNALLARGVEVITDSESQHPCLRPSGARRAGADVPVGPARRSPCRCMARSATWSSMRRSRGPARCRRRSWRPTAAWCAWRPGRRRSSTMSMPAGWRATATALVPLDGAALRERRKLLWNGAAAATLVIDKRGRAMAPPKVVAARHRGRGRRRWARPSSRACSEMLADSAPPSGATTGGSRRRRARPCGASCARTSARSR